MFRLPYGKMHAYHVTSILLMKYSLFPSKICPSIYSRNWKLIISWIFQHLHICMYINILLRFHYLFTQQNLTNICFGTYRDTCAVLRLWHHMTPTNKCFHLFTLIFKTEYLSYVSRRNHLQVSVQCMYCVFLGQHMSMLPKRCRHRTIMSKTLDISHHQAYFVDT